jgi:hypothetical protein
MLLVAWHGDVHVGRAKPCLWLLVHAQRFHAELDLR